MPRRTDQRFDVRMEEFEGQRNSRGEDREDRGEDRGRMVWQKSKQQRRNIIFMDPRDMILLAFDAVRDQ